VELAKAQFDLKALSELLNSRDPTLVTQAVADAIAFEDKLSRVSLQQASLLKFPHGTLKLIFYSFVFLF
jgi:hypothetical protein